jgi:amidohydrolase
MRQNMNFNDLKQKFIQEAKENQREIVKLRRYLHSHPETAYEEFLTSNFIESQLKKLGLKTHRVQQTGIVSKIETNSKAITIALRADIDALNIQEEVNLKYKSTNQGKMHACGHDAHTAMLLGAAKIIQKYSNHLKNNILFIFQPAEEGGGGAKQIISEGYFNNVNTVFGIHVWSFLPTGVIGLRKGPIFASSDRFTIVIKGKGGHAAAPHQSVDPTSVIIEIYNALQKIVSREKNPFEPCVLSLPVLAGSDAHNIIPNKGIIKGTLRTLSSDMREYMIKRIKDVVQGYSEAWRCSGNVKFDPIGYPSVVNNPEIIETIKPVLQSIAPIKQMKPTMVGEDFSFYLQNARGAFLTLGINNKEKGIIYPHHHPKFQVDESILWKGTAIYSILGFFHTFADS